MKAAAAWHRPSGTCGGLLLPMVPAAGVREVKRGELAELWVQRRPNGIPAVRA